MSIVDPDEAEAAMVAGFRGDTSPPCVTCPACGATFEPTSGAVRATESTEAISGQRSTQDTRQLLTKAVEDRVRAESGKPWAYAYVRDFTDTEVVYDHDGATWQCGYTLDEDGTVGTVALGDPAEVVEQTWYVPAAGGADASPDDPEDADAEAAVEAAWDPAAHPRGAAGTATGGQFTSGGGTTAAAKATPKKGVKATPKKAGPAATLGYSGGNKGTGYGQKGGDANVKALQSALNRLGLTDADGKKLAVDGKFGPRTTAAVKKLQKALGLRADGKVTADLLAKVKRMKALPKTPVKKPVKATPARRAPAARRTAPKKRATPTPQNTGSRRMGMSREAFDAEMQDRVDGRVVEALGADESGGRVFRVRIIAVGESRNGRRYTESVLRAAAPLYEGAKAYDHHRTADELRTSTIAGLVGSYRNVEAATDGLYGDLHLLPSATHTAEALDVTLAAEADGLPALVGISHDVMATYRPVIAAGRRLQEATAITKVHSADVVADPAAGGRAVRMVAGGADPEEEENAVPVVLADVLAALTEATDDELAAAGLTRRTPETTEITDTPPTGAVPTTEADAGEPKGSFIAGLMIRQKLEEAGLAPMREAITAALPERVTEADIDAQVAAYKSVLASAERAGLAPTIAAAQVTREAFDKKVAALDGMLDHTGRTPGYRSLKAAWADITGARVVAWDEDINKRILRESYGGGYDSDGRVGNGSETRSSESLSTTSWPQVLGDSITRRAIALYNTPNLQTWRKVVSSMPPVNDFREQKRVRIGGYGVLPTVNQGQPYQPLTSPTDEEAVYSVIKRGGTEDLTWETVVNDDIGKVQMIPRNLGLAAAITLYRFVWDLLKDNATCTFDSTALFDAAHANTDTSSALSQSTLSIGRRKMRDQAAYNHSVNLLSTVPRLLIVPNELEELAFQLCTSAVAIPSTPAGPSDTPNLHKNMDYEVIDYWTDANDWFLAGDPLMIPLIEVGFLFGKQEPELFTQSDPNTGSVFNADTITYKIRHPYSGTPLDFRGFYRGQG